MVTLETLREEMKNRLAIDKEIRSVDVHADTIDEALADASVQFDTKVQNLQYEVLEKGSDGFLGFGKKPWALRIYQDPSTIKRSAASGEGVVNGVAAEGEEAVQKDADGIFYVRHFEATIALKVILPIGNGMPVEFKDVMAEAQRSDTTTLDEDLVRKCVQNGTDGEYTNIGTYKHVPAGDVLIAVDITKDEMSGTITVTPPAMGGAEATYDMIVTSLRQQGVVACILEDKVKEFVDNPVYNVPFEVAAAKLPVDGNDAYISYNFETDKNKLRAKVSDSGNVDFKELNQIQNVVAGQVLATKILAERGQGGKTVFGRYLEAKNGKDIQIQLGENTHLDKDGVTIIADCDGEVMLFNNKIVVEPVKYLDAVNIKTGNITFLGSVVVKGSVDDGFDIKASGNIEIGGSVGKCKIEADGNVIIRAGVFGKEEGYIKAGKSVWAKFVQAAKIEAEENIVVMDSLMNSEATALKNIVLKGKKAQITGGHLFATEEICARNIGSPGGGSETILEVGVDPRAKKQLLELQENQAKLLKEYESVELDVQTLEQQKKLRKTLPQEKQENLDRLTARKMEISGLCTEMNEEIEKIQERLRELKAVGKVKVEGTVYAGVKVYVRDVLDEVKNETKSVTFYYDSSFVKRGDYEPPSITEEEINGIAAN